MKKVELWADGCSLNNPGESGAGVVLVYNGYEKDFSIPLGQSTNMRAELSAIIEGLKLITEACEVYIFSDSQVTIDIINGTKQASANLDLWQEYHKAAMFHRIRAEWIKKDTRPLNKRCHNLANQAAYKGLR